MFDLISQPLVDSAEKNPSFIMMDTTGSVTGANASALAFGQAMSSLQGQGQLQFPAEIPLQAGNVLVHFGSTEGTVTLEVSKGEAFVDPSTQNRRDGSF